MNKKLTYGVIAGVVLALAYYLISPLWQTKVVNDASPLSNQALVPTTEQLPSEEQRVQQSSSPTPAITSKIIAQGDFIAKAHDVAGKAILISKDGKKILRFENFETINGPDLKIYMSRDFTKNDYISLGDIKATKGNVNYELPTTIDTDTYNHVLVWCEQFRVLFSAAELTPL